MTFREELSRRILVLDGAMGTMLQKGFSEEEVMRQYIDAGADIIITNTFNANRISQQALGQEDKAWTMAYEAACRARRLVDEAPRKIYLAGGCGPTGKSLSLATDADDPSHRDLGFDDFVEAYGEQFDALLKGGVDLILLETCFDPLNAKAAIYALEQLGNPVPLIISATVSDRSGRTLTGHTLEAFYRSVCHAPTLAAFGVNCALGPEEMAPLVREIAAFSSHPLIFYPNAGLPVGDEYRGGTPDIFYRVVSELAASGCINIAGGCCGTTPEHIREVKRAVEGKMPRVPVNHDDLYVSGLESFRISPELNFTNIGERTNVAGSKKFARLIAESDYPAALAVARDQIAGGADIIDINMDDPMVDSSEKMREFLRHIASEPDIARAAVMIDSSHWETLVEGLKNCPGKPIVNSISLKDGEEAFLRKAKEIRDLGAAVVVMAFDEQGQATSFERKIEISARSYRLLTEKVQFKPQDIIFDCNILSIGTGIAEHSRFGVDFIRAVEWIKGNLPGARTSGGVSNLSFAFRGNNAVREAMHSAFLYHAVKAGLDMAIVNPQMLMVYDEIDPSLRKAVEDVIFDADPDATARLVELASSFAQAGPKVSVQTVQAVSDDPLERLSDALVKGFSSTLEEDVKACLDTLGSAVAVVEGPLMAGMERVGDLFSQGKMFLPQVVKSARVMREAVAFLQPFMGESRSEGGRPRFLIATVQGDVHDIGKNITATVLQCGGFEVKDLGVMVPSALILEEADRLHPAIIGVSGLITPSLNRMEELCRMMKERGMDIPLFVGGAAASALHTAVRLAPLYDKVFYSPDASATAVMAKKYLADPASFVVEEAGKQAALREMKASSKSAGAAGEQLHTGAFEGKPSGEFLKERCFVDIPLHSVPAGDLIPFFDWRMFRAVCGCKDGNRELEEEASAILKKTDAQLLVCARFFDCRREGDEIVSDSFRLPMLRDGASLADFFPETGSAQMGVFALRMGKGSLSRCCPDCDSEFLPHAIAVCLAEAASSSLESLFKQRLPEGMKLIMPGIGYACCPDHSLKRDLLALLPSELGIVLTDSCAMIPEASICGLVIAHSNAAYCDIRKTSPERLEAYAALRGFSAEEKKLFLGHLL